MSIRTSKNCKGYILSDRSPVRTLLTSEFLSAMAWMARRKDKKTGSRIGKVTQVDKIIKYEKDTFSLYGHTHHGHTVHINDVRGEAVFLPRLPDGKMDIANSYLFCLGGGQYLLTDWNCVWKAMSQLYKDHGTVIYTDCWRMNRNKFVEALKKEIASKGCF